MEDDDLSTVNARPGKDPGRHTGGGDLLIDQKEVSDEQGRLHGARGNTKRLDDKGDDEDRGHHDGEQRLDGRQDALFGGMGVGMGNAETGGRVGVDGGMVHFYTSQPSLLESLTIALSARCFLERRRSMAMRAASCWACFLVLPSDSAMAMDAPSLSSM